MTNLELIEGLCVVIELQAELISRQAEVIAQAETGEEIASELTQMRNSAEEKYNSLRMPDP